MRRRGRLPIDPPEVNLVPLLDMVSLLIQMLLVNAQFGVFTELETHLAGEAEPTSTEKLGLEVSVEKAGYRLSWTQDGGRKERLVGCPKDCADAGDWDALGLRAAARELKTHHLSEQQVVLTPGEGVPFEAVIRAMDAVRTDDSGQPLFPDLVVGT